LKDGPFQKLGFVSGDPGKSRLKSKNDEQGTEQPHAAQGTNHVPAIGRLGNELLIQLIFAHAAFLSFFTP
jgi:hypothetical protein